jgi:hypothetical protein
MNHSDALAAFVAWLVNESGWTVEEGGQFGSHSVAPHRNLVPPLVGLRP